jgi:hypothetical protein
VTERQLQIEFQRSGGFAGAVLSGSVDARDLAPAEADELLDLVDRADLPALSRRASGPRPGKPDRFQYDLRVTLGDQQHQVTLGETDVPESLRPLLDRLLELARRR